MEVSANWGGPFRGTYATDCNLILGGLHCGHFVVLGDYYVCTCLTECFNRSHKDMMISLHIGDYGIP